MPNLAAYVIEEVVEDGEDPGGEIEDGEDELRWEDAEGLVRIVMREGKGGNRPRGVYLGRSRK